MMLRPSKKLALALEAVVDIAFHGMAEPVQSQDIAERLTLPRRYLEQVMQQLVRAKILKGVRGPRGGYRLAREMRRISVGDIVKIVQGLDEEENGHGPVSTSVLGKDVMAPFWSTIEAKFMHELGQMTIEDLCTQAQQKSDRGQPSMDVDFSI